jgi:site-specific DNA-methyltransferase (adenine-specific)
MTPSHQIRVGHCLELLQAMPSESVQCCVTSPPYYGLRDYNVEGQIGLEETPAEFIARLVEVFREVRRVLRKDGTAWVNMGDSYSSRPNGPVGGGGHQGPAPHVAVRTANARRSGHIPAGLKHKDLMGMPWRLAFALQDDGWYLRQDIIWHKPNPMPESTRDRCTKAHEYLFLLSKSRRYHCDMNQIREPAIWGSTPTGVGFGHGFDEETKPRAVRPAGWADSGKKDAASWASAERQGRGSKRNSFARETKQTAGEHGQTAQHRPCRPDVDYSMTRNKRSVWTVPTHSFKGAHFATFPPDLIRPCILAGAPRGGLVLDPFGGAGTTGLVAMQEGRCSLLLELNPEYAALAQARLNTAWIDGAAQMDILLDSKESAA